MVQTGAGDVSCQPSALLTSSGSTSCEALGEKMRPHQGHCLGLVVVLSYLLGKIKTMYHPFIVSDASFGNLFIDYYDFDFEVKMFWRCITYIYWLVT